jgi:hypothetical protein
VHLSVAALGGSDELEQDLSQRHDRLMVARLAFLAWLGCAMKLSKEAMTAIILALHEKFSSYETGLPVHEESKMAHMREVISEAVAEFES